jgi:hypothetical protein
LPLAGCHLERKRPDYVKSAERIIRRSQVQILPRYSKGPEKPKEACVGRREFHTRPMNRVDASDLATERLIDWVRRERLAVRELAGAAIAYGAATDQSYEATARRIASCVATLQVAPPEHLVPPALTPDEVALVDWIRVLDAVVAAASAA